MSMFAMLHGVSPEFLRSCQTDSSMLDTLEYPEKETPDFLVIHCWGALTYLLGGDETGAWNSEILTSRTIISGECIDPEHETGITPAFYLTVDEVIKVASELAHISDEALLSRYEPENMHDLHPIGEWTDCPEIRRELLDDFHALQAFYAVQANAGNAVINYLV